MQNSGISVQMTNHRYTFAIFPHPTPTPVYFPPTPQPPNLISIPSRIP